MQDKTNINDIVVGDNVAGEHPAGKDAAFEVSDNVLSNNEAGEHHTNQPASKTSNNEVGEHPTDDTQAKSSDVAGLGVDIVEIERIQKVLERTPRFKTRVYTEAEQKYCDGFKKKAHLHYATHFAAKEAALKALGTGIAQGIGLQDIEVSHNEKGKPEIILHNKAKELAEKAGVLELHLSLSRTHSTAVANVIAITASVRPQPKEEHIDPREQLAREFKKLRNMLDNLEEAFAADANEEQDSKETPAADETQTEATEEIEEEVKETPAADENE